jgi:hypothetical protein
MFVFDTLRGLSALAPSLEALDPTTPSLPSSWRSPRRIYCHTTKTHANNYITKIHKIFFLKNTKIQKYVYSYSGSQNTTTKVCWEGM